MYYISVYFAVCLIFYGKILNMTQPSTEERDSSFLRFVILWLFLGFKIWSKFICCKAAGAGKVQREDADKSTVNKGIKH